jgi:hypothetical protein
LALLALAAGAVLVALHLASARLGGAGLWPGEGEALAAGFAASTDAALLGWNALYLVAGSHLGLLPYLLPLLLLALSWERGEGRTGLLVGVLLTAVLVTVGRPFDFAGAPPAAGNRLLLPVYAALWCGAVRPVRPWAVAAIVAAAAAFLWPLWLGPRQAISRLDRLPTIAARALLPYETTQRGLPGTEESRGEIWLRVAGLADPGPAGSAGRSGAPLPSAPGGPSGPTRLAGDAPARLLVSSPRPLAALKLAFGRRAPSRLEVGGGEAGETLFRPDGGVGFRVELGEPRARHPMWWSPEEPQSLYLLELRLPGAPPEPIGFRLEPVYPGEGAEAPVGEAGAR